MQIFNRKKALELVDNDENLLAVLIDSFLNGDKFLREELDSFISAERLDEAAGYVHATKGAARQLCLEKLQASGQNLEDILRGKAQGDIKTGEDIMFTDYNEAVRLLKSNTPS